MEKRHPKKLEPFLWLQPLRNPLRYTNVLILLSKFEMYSGLWLVLLNIANEGEKPFFVFLVSMRYITILPGYVVACGKENDIMFIWKKFKIENYSMFL